MTNQFDNLFVVINQGGAWQDATRRDSENKLHHLLPLKRAGLAHVEVKKDCFVKGV